MRLSDYEKETIILFNEEEETANVQTYNKSLKSCLNKLFKKYPDQMTITPPSSGNCFFCTVPKAWVKIAYEVVNEPPKSQ